MHSQIDRQKKRQAVEEKALVQNAQRAEPAESAGEKDDAGEITEQQIPQPSATRIFAGKPDRADERGESNPAKPALIKRRETKDAEQTARDGRKPGPQVFHSAEHGPQSRTSNPKSQVPRNFQFSNFQSRQNGLVPKPLAWELFGIWRLGIGIYAARHPRRRRRGSRSRRRPG